MVKICSMEKNDIGISSVLLNDGQFYNIRELRIEEDRFCSAL